PLGVGSFLRGEMPLHRWNGNAADREAHKVVAVGETAARHARDARLAEEGENVLARLELAPVVDGAAIVGVHLEEEAVSLVHVLKLAAEACGGVGVEGANALADLWALSEELDIGHVAELPVAGQRGGAVGPARADSRRQLWIAEAHPTTAIAGDRMRFGE